MQSKPENLYEYAVVRFVPKVEREEFINVGLIMMCKRRRWIRTAIVADFARVKAFAPALAISENMLRKHLDAFESMASGHVSAGEMSCWPSRSVPLAHGSAQRVYPDVAASPRNVSRPRCRFRPPFCRTCIVTPACHIVKIDYFCMSI